MSGNTEEEVNNTAFWLFFQSLLTFSAPLMLCLANGHLKRTDTRNPSINCFKSLVFGRCSGVWAWFLSAWSTTSVTDGRMWRVVSAGFTLTFPCTNLRHLKSPPFCSISMACGSKIYPHRAAVRGFQRTRPIVPSSWVSLLLLCIEQWYPRLLERRN